VQETKFELVFNIFDFLVLAGNPNPFGGKKKQGFFPSSLSAWGGGQKKRTRFLGLIRIE
jgi:hypothetical protein